MYPGKHLTLVKLILLVLPYFFSFPDLYSQESGPFKPVDFIPANKALIYLYWISSGTGGQEYVVINEQPVSYLPLYEKGCLVYFADPGIITVNSLKGKKRDLVLQVSARETVYLRGFSLAGETTFRRMTPSDGLKDLNRCRLYEKQFLVNQDNFRSVALISTTISRAEATDAPLSSSAIFIEKMYAILDKIILMERQVLPSLRETAADEISKYFNSRVIYGEGMKDNSTITTLKSKYDSVTPVIINDKSYPGLNTIRDDLIPFPGYHGNISHFFKDEDNYKQVISEIGKAVNTDIIAICNLNYTVSLKGNSFINSGKIDLSTQLYLFYPDGRLLAFGNKSIPLVREIKGYDLNDFEDALKIFPFALVPILEEITYEITRKMGKNK